MNPKIRAYCTICRKMVSDDLIESAQGTENAHEHRVVLFREVGLIEPGGIIQKVLELTQTAYLQEASRVDAELITAKVMQNFNIPLPRPMVTKIIEELLRVVREVAVEDLKVQKKALKEREELAMKQEAKATKKTAKKPKETKDKAPETEAFYPEDDEGEKLT